jgi:hypothetical protein
MVEKKLKIRDYNLYRIVTCFLQNVWLKCPGYGSNRSLASPIKESVCFANVSEDGNEYVAYVNKDEQKNIYEDSVKYPWYEDELRNNNRNHSNSAISSPISNCNDKIASLQRLDADVFMDMDTVRVYYTEDTPTFASPFGSQSNLSALSMLSVSDENLGCSANLEEEEDEQHQGSFYDEERLSGRLDPYGTDASSDFSEDNDKCYDDEAASCNASRRIDVSPFDSQMNLANFSLLCIQEENEEDEVELLARKEQQRLHDETDKSTKDGHYVEDDNAYKRPSRDNSDYSDEDSKVLEECIKSGVSKIARRTNSAHVDERYLF